MGIKQQINLKQTEAFKYHPFISRLVIVDTNAKKNKTAEKVLNFQNIGLLQITLPQKKSDFLFFSFKCRQNALNFLCILKEIF